MMRIAKPAKEIQELIDVVLINLLLAGDRAAYGIRYVKRAQNQLMFLDQELLSTSYHLTSSTGHGARIATA